MVKKFNLPSFGFEVEIGKVAKQADGAVWFQQEGTVLLATVVAAKGSDFPGFLPLTVDYREHYSAAGKIPGGYYKREGKSTDHEVLTARLIDRSIRPLFPQYFFDQVQVLATVYSIDKERSPSAIALIATSLALIISDIPFYEPIGAVEVGRINGQWVINPKYSEMNQSDVRLMVAGTHEGICMVEGIANEMHESDFLDVLFKAHDEIKKIIEWQREIQKEVGKTKRAEDTTIDWTMWRTHAVLMLTEEKVKRAFVEDKAERSEVLKSLQQEFFAYAQQAQPEIASHEKLLTYLFDEVFEEKVTEVIFALQHRIDKRDFTTIRPISVEVGLLPFVHGSALFTRGQTQALASLTLGGGQDEQRLESLMGDDDTAADGSFMLHYNFPSFSVGEVRPSRGPSRRDVGHGHLAASAIRYMLPDKEKFPYTIRIVVDILESNGSSSMATVCSSTMALMQGGVPIKKMVAGVVIGLLRSNEGKVQLLTDINGFEDGFGLMDFKIAGTSEGITAVQLDIKYKGGFKRDLFEAALQRSREGRLHILEKMRACMSEPAKEMSELVPKVVNFKVDSDKIGAIIGTGGKTIREIIDTTKVSSIDIEDDGMVKIFGVSNDAIEKATKWVKVLAGQLTIGERFTGKIRRIVEFGMFVELVPGQDGLVHVSNIPREYQKTFQRQYKVDDIVSVEVIDYEQATGRIKLRLLDK